MLAANLHTGELVLFDEALVERLDHLRARFDAGLAWVHYPEGLGGLGLPRLDAAIIFEARAHMKK